MTTHYDIAGKPILLGDYIVFSRPYNETHGHELRVGRVVGIQEKFLSVVSARHGGGSRWWKHNASATPMRNLGQILVVPFQSLSLEIINLLAD